MEAEGSTQEPIEVGAPGIDVAKLAAQIRSEVERKIEEGVYPPELLSEVQVRPDPVRAAIDRMRSVLPFHPGVPVLSHRPGIGPALTFAKRVVRRGLKWYTVGLIAQFEAFAAATSALAEALATRVDQLDRESSKIRKSVANLEQRLATLSTELPASGISSEPGQISAAARSQAAELTFDQIEFENQFRGSEDEIERRQSTYVDLFHNVSGRVVDIGCGRGEFLTVLRRAGIDAYGVDHNPDMVERCQEKGLEAQVGDATAHLREVPPGSLGGVFSAQVIEHLDPPALVAFFELAATALGRGGVLVTETLNPRSLSTFVNALYVDLGHVRPLHPFTLEHLAKRAGFRSIEVRYTSEPEGLLPIPATADDERSRLVAENFDRINRLLFGPQDFAIVARR